MEYTLYGPYNSGGKAIGRQHVILVYTDGTRKTKSYSKYLLEKKIGRELTSDETCDHKDDNFTNNDLDNLQALSRGDNIRKSSPGPNLVTLICDYCLKSFERTKAQIRGEFNYCSKSCNGKDNH